MASIGFGPNRLRFVRYSFSRLILLLSGVSVQKITQPKIKTAFISGRIPAYFTYGFSWVVLAKRSLEDRKKKDMTSLLRDADMLYNDIEYKKVYDLLLPYKDDKNDEILWRLARTTFELAKSQAKGDEKKKLNLEAFCYVENALKINDKNFAVHKWMAILLDVISEYEGTKAKILKSELIKQHITKATELNPSDPTSYYILGMWCYAVADLPWYQRQAASALFATPPTSSYAEALEAFERAENIEPKFYSMNLLMLGKCYLKLNQQPRAIEYLRQAAAFPLLTEDDKKAHSEATELLKSLKVAV